MTPIEVGLVGVAGLIGLVFLGVRVVYAAAMVGFLGLAAIIGFDAAAGVVGMIPHSKATSYTLSVLPLFILMGYLAFHAGLTASIFAAARAWLGWIPGGLAVASVFASAGFGAVSGASTATAAVFSRVAIPEMLSHGYDRRLAAGVVAAGGTLAALIPPSAILVVYAILVEESVGALLLAGFIPALFTALIYVLAIIGLAVWRPGLAPPIHGRAWADRVKTLSGLVPIVLVVVIIFSALYFGWATPTEAGAVGAGVVFILALMHGMGWHSLREALLESARLTAMIFSLIWGILIFVRFLAYAELPDVFAHWVLNLPLPPLLIMIGILLVYAVLGMFMDAIGMMILTLPIVYPAVVALGYDPIWFGIVVVKMAEICLITPPIGLNCYVVSGVRPDIPVVDVFRGAAPFFVADVVTVALLLAFPEIVLWLPKLVAG